MDPVSFAIAVGPLAAYVLLLGLICRSGQPLVVSGAKDLATLGAALSGVAVVGPLSLFRPEDASTELGAWVWLFLIALYWLLVILASLVGRPRLVVYNATAEQVRSVLAEAAPQLDPAARWAGTSLSLPTRGVEFHLESDPWRRSASLVATGAEQDLANWRRLARQLERSLGESHGRSTGLGVWLIGLGVLLIAAVVGWITSAPEAVELAWRHYLEL